MGKQFGSVIGMCKLPLDMNNIKLPTSSSGETDSLGTQDLAHAPVHCAAGL